MRREAELTQAEMARALDVGIFCFNVESEAELELLAQVAAEKGKIAHVSLRVNPDVDANTHPYIQISWIGLPRKWWRQGISG